MLRVFALVLPLSVILGTLPLHAADATKRGQQLVAAMVAKVGTMEQLKALKDVEYTYTYRGPDGKEDVSQERYVFDGELSWARYDKHEKIVMPNKSGTVVQGYNGNKTWVTHNGTPVADSQTVKTADFLRKTNYYWFTMMPKLLDPGVKHVHEGESTLNGKVYDRVKVTFEQGVGDVQDIYVLFINRETGLVDQFLFTVMDFGMRDPLLMEVQYVDVQGLKLPAKRRYAPAASWDGGVKGTPQWTDEIMTQIRFSTGLDPSVFNPPQTS